MLIHEIIKKERKRKNLSQLDISGELGMSIKTYRKYENGDVEFSIRQLIKLSDILGLDSSCLFNIEKLYYENQKEPRTSSIIINQLINDQTFKLTDINNSISKTITRLKFFQNQINDL